MVAMAMAGCAAGGEGSVTSSGGVQRRTSASGGVTAAGSASAGSAVGSGSSGGSSGLTGGFDATHLSDGGCQSISSHATTDCSASTWEVWGVLVDHCAGGTPLTSHYAIADFNNLSEFAVDQQCGFFYFCVDKGHSVTPQIKVANHLETVLSTITPSGNLAIPATPGIALLCDSEVAALTQSSISQPFNPDAGLVLVDASANGSASIPCQDLSGWTFALLTSDGGIADAGVLYGRNGAFDPSATATDALDTTAFFYDVDTQGGPLRVVGHNPKFDLADGGTLCPLDDGEVSEVVVPHAGLVTFIPYFVL